MKKLFPLAFAFLVICGLWWRLVVMSSVPFYDWDESIYAQVAREWMRQPGMTLFYNGALWFEKPPALLALIGSLFYIFGTSEIIARVPSLVAGVVCLVLIYQATTSITKNRYAGFVSVLLCASTPYFLERSTVVNVDIFLSVGWLLYVSSDTFRTRFIGTCIAVYTKSFLGFIPLVVDMVVSVYKRQLTLRKLGESLLIISVGLVWHVYMWFQYGSQFVDSHIKDHLIARVTKPIELHFGGKYFYIEKLWDNFDWLLLVLGIAIFMWFWSFLRNKSSRLLDMHFAVPLFYFALLTISRAKLHWYVLPLIVFGSIAILYAVSQLTMKKYQNIFYLSLGLFLALRFVTSLGTIQSNAPLPPQVALARCKLQLPEFHKISYLVPPIQRKDAHVIEAAQLNIGSSFIYGSAPTFLFYLDRPVAFYYKTDLFLNDLSKYDAIAIHRDDSELRGKAEQLLAPGSTPVFSCTRGDITMIVRGTTKGIAP